MSPRPTELPESGFEPALRHAREGRFAEAIDAVEHGISHRDPEAVANPAVTALAEIGRRAQAAGALALAEQALERAIALRSRYPDLHHLLAQVLMAAGRGREARRALEKALALQPRFTAARLDLALLDAREGLVGESLDALRQLARDTRIEDANAFQQGLQRLSQAEWSDAEPLLRRALALSDPEMRERLEGFRERLESGDPAGALGCLEDLMPRYAAYPDLHDLVGVAELKLGRADDALASFARALELNPDFHDARVHLAQALEALGESVQAGEQVAMVLDRDPAHAGALALEEAWAERRHSHRFRRRDAAATRSGGDGEPEERAA
jgi:tetratricopeptide (TPR) repeat protein